MDKGMKREEAEEKEKHMIKEQRQNKKTETTYLMQELTYTTQ